jgi:hypothetical protein
MVNGQLLTRGSAPLARSLPARYTRWISTRHDSICVSLAKLIVIDMAVDILYQIILNRGM